MLHFLIWIYSATAVILLAEIIAGRHKGAYTRSDVPLMIISFLAGRFVIAPLAAVAIAGLYGLVLPHFKGALSTTPFWAAFRLLLLFEEFVFYWVHRWAHENRSGKEQFLWKLHRTHHSGKHMNVVLQARTNLFWYAVIPSGWSLGLGLFLGLGSAAAAVTITLVAWNTITHSNFRWDDAIRSHPRFGPPFRGMEHVFVSPGIHHTHHGYGKDGAGYRNSGPCCRSGIGRLARCISPRVGRGAMATPVRPLRGPKSCSIPWSASDGKRPPTRNSDDRASAGPRIQRSFWKSQSGATLAWAGRSGASASAFGKAAQSQGC